MTPACTAAQAAAFRLARHHIAGRGRTSLVDACRDSGGIQAQVMSAAETALWTRRRTTTRGEIRAALWDRRDLVRTTLMRLTLHVVPAADLSMYIAALRPGSMAAMHRIFARFGAKPAQVDKVTATIIDALGDGPRTQQQLLARARASADRRARTWLDFPWVAMRPAIIDGSICYGPPRGAEATFVRVDRWLPAQRSMDVADARAELFRRFLSAFGPATAHDFAKWSGLKTGDAKAVVDAARDEIVSVHVDGAPGWIGRSDLPALRRSVLDESAVRLLGAFDPLLLAHATKDHLVEPRFYTRVYRPQWWISPVVLRGGRAIGVWFPKTTGKIVTLRVELFESATAAVKRGIEREADALGRFLDARCDVRIAVVRA